MNNIAFTKGVMEAPADMLFSIAYGLATGEHWWLWSPRTRRQNGWTPPTLTSMEEVRRAAEETAEELGDRAPKISFESFDGELVFRWEPFQDRYNGERFVEITVPDGATVGAIEWSTGTGRPSSFIGALLAVLPGATDEDDVLAISMMQRQEWAAREVKTKVVAARQGVLGYISVEHPLGERLWFVTAEYGHPNVEEEGFDNGYEPCRAFTPSGEERRIARFLRKRETVQMVKDAAPFPWKVRE